MLKLVVFDFDGVIADSEPAHFEMFRRVLAEDGIDLDWKNYCQNYLGYSDLEGFSQILKDQGLQEDSDRVAELCERKKTAFADYIREQNIILPGVRELLADLKAHGVHSAICSGALRGEVELIAGLAGLLDYFEVIVAAEDVERGKPDPQGYCLARERINASVQPEVPIQPEETIAIEDSIWGIQSAKGAGFKCLGVATTYRADQLTLADRVVKTLAEVDVEYLREMNGQQ